MNSDVVVATWSHTSYSDAWDVYYGQYKKYAPFLKHYLMINKHIDNSPENCEVIINDESKKFGNRLSDSLKKINNKYILYSQEDFILYDNVEEDRFYSLLNFLDNSDFSFLRLMKSGINEGNPGKLLDKQLGIYEVPQNCIYLYCLQASIWNRKDLIKLYDLYKPKNMMEAELKGSDAFRFLNLKGSYIYNDEKKRGRLHWDSSTYPYISSALHGGSHGRPARWAFTEYPELKNILNEYNVDPNIRGIM